MHIRIYYIYIYCHYPTYRDHRCWWAESNTSGCSRLDKYPMIASSFFAIPGGVTVELFVPYRLVNKIGDALRIVDCISIFVDAMIWTIVLFIHTFTSPHPCMVITHVLSKNKRWNNPIGSMYGTWIFTFRHFLLFMWPFLHRHHVGIPVPIGSMYGIYLPIPLAWIYGKCR